RAEIGLHGVAPHGIAGIGQVQRDARRVADGEAGRGGGQRPLQVDATYDLSRASAGRKSESPCGAFSGQCYVQWFWAMRSCQPLLKSVLKVILAKAGCWCARTNPRRYPGQFHASPL